MLKLLQIRNFMLIDSLDIEFVDGLCIITGETGAGKSIIVNSLNFLSCEKSASVNMRNGTGVSLVVGVFSINEFFGNILKSYCINTNSEDLMIKRVICENGTIKNFVNDIEVTLKTLSALMREMMDINMQGKKIENYRKVLDEYGRVDLSNLKKIYKKLQNSKKEQNALLEDVNALEIETKYMLSIKNELSILDLKVNEEQGLLEKRNKIINKEKRLILLNEALTMLSEVNEKTNKAQKILSSLGDKCYEGNIATLESFSIETSEMLLQVQENLSLIEEFSEDDLLAIDARISKIKDVERKYEKTTRELISYMAFIDEKLQHYENVLCELKKLDDLSASLKREYMLEAESLHAKRKEVAATIEEGIRNALKRLELQYCKFFVDFSLGEKKITDHGFDEIDFKISFNPDSEPNSLMEVASGGEKSRFLLALKMVFVSDQILVCDEMDTGFSGSTSEAVGEALLDLASSRQVIVVTHQPQVASKGNFHLKILKKHVEGKTIISFVKLSQEGRIEEIARMVSGSQVTEESIIFSKKLLCINDAL